MRVGLRRKTRDRLTMKKKNNKEGRKETDSKDDIEDVDNEELGGGGFGVVRA